MTTATTYRAWELTGFSMKEKLVTASKREEQKLEPHQIKIKVKACSLNFRDILMARGHYNAKMPLPVVPLSDGAGEVVEVGSAVTKFKKGDRVSPNFMPDWISGDVTNEAAKTSLGCLVDGMAREYAVFDENSCVHIPAHLSYEEAATLPCAALTAWSSLMVNGQLKPGQTVLTMGTGGVSIFALQLAKLNGARVIATSSEDDKLSRLKEMGADVTINYKKNAQWDEAVLKATGGEGVDHVVEVGGSGTLERSMKAAALNGHVSVIGILEGITGGMNLLPLIMKSLRLQGVFVGSRQRFDEMNRAIELHQLKPVIDKVFDADKIVDALDHMESGKHFGKIVLKY